MDPSQDEVAPQLSSLSAFLRREREGILAEWQLRVRDLPIARTLDQAALLDHLPHILDRLTAMVEDMEDGRPIREPGTAPETHAIERLEEGYDLDDVVQEFAVLRQCVLDLWSSQPRRAPGSHVLNRAIDQAIMTAVLRYTRARERTLVALDRISAAVLESQDLEALLQALIRVLLETTAAVDSVAVYLRDGEQLHLRASAGMENHVTDLTSVALGSETCAGQIAASRTPLEMRDAAHSPLTSDALRRHGARAFYGVPMTRLGEVVGVAQMASRTAYDFSTEDKLLFRAMVERATTAIAHHQLRSELEREHRRIQALLDVLPVAVWVAEPSGKLVLANRAAREIWGPIPTIAGIESYQEFRGWRAATGQPLGADDWGMARALRRQEVVPPEELDIETFDGRRRTILNAAAPISAEDGTLLGAVVVNVDITERKEAEKREQAARAETERLLAMLDALFAGAPVGLAFLDRAYRYLRINETLAAINGVPAQEHVGRTIREVIPESADFLEGLLRRVFESGESLTGIDLSNAPRTSPERLRHFQLSAYPVRLPDGSIVGAGATLVEITALREAIRAREDVLSVAAHDLRSPLASIKLQVQSLARTARAADTGTLPAKATEAKLTKIDRQLDRVSGMLEELLEASRLDAGRLRLDLEDLDLASLVEDVAAQHAEVLANAGCALKLDLQAPLTGRWDALRLQQVIANLLTNAAKYGKGKPVDVTLAGDDGRARLTVRDHGIGIAREDQHAIFERFERVGDTRAHHGLGLGLWIVRTTVEAMGGRINVQSEPGEGAAFVVDLPRWPRGR